MSALVEVPAPKKPRAALRLVKAATIIEEVAAEMDIRESKCGCCGATRKENWTEHQAHIELVAQARKLRIWASRLRKAEMEEKKDG